MAYHLGEVQEVLVPLLVGGHEGALHQGLGEVVPLVTGLGDCSLIQALEASLVACPVVVVVAQAWDVEIQAVSFQVATGHQEWALVEKALFVVALWVLLT